MDDAKKTAFNPAAPVDEQRDALSQLQQQHMPTATDILPLAEAVKFAEKVRLEKSAMAIDRTPRAKTGPQSVMLDEWTQNRGANFYEPGGILTFPMMRAMVERTPVLGAAVGTRVRQVRRFCSVSQDNGQPGFRIRGKDPDHKPSPGELDSIKALQRFFEHSGWEHNAVKRDKLERAPLGDVMAQLTEDSLVMDSAAIELDLRRDGRGLDGFYVVDGATVRLCSEDGYEGDDKIFALQVINGAVVTGYTREELIYRPRNPTSSIYRGGYGRSEVELMTEVVTGFLNAMQLNIAGFNHNEVPPGLLLLSGNFDNEQLDAFRRYLTSMISGARDRFRLPFMSSKDGEAAASFVKLGDEFNEMYFSKWMTFLVSIICALFGMSPDEINFESFSAGRSSLSGTDTAEKLADSKDKGLRPLLAYFEQLFTAYVVERMSDKYVFEWTGLEEIDQDKQHELNKAAWSYNELRAEQGLKPVKGPMGDCPINPVLVGPYLQMMQQEQQEQQGEDFGQPPEGGAQQGGEPPEGGPPGPPGPPEAGGEPPEGAEQPPDYGPQQDFGGGGGGDYGKADFGKSVIWAI